MASRIMMAVRGKARPLTLSRGNNISPLLNSAATKWAGLPLEMHCFRPIEASIVTGPVQSEYGILVVMNGRVDIVLRDNGREIALPSLPGTTYLLAGDRPFNVIRIAGSAEAAAVHVPQEWLGRLLLDKAPAGFGMTKPLICDETVHSLVRAMRDEIAGGVVTGRLYAESLSMALLSYIVERVPSSCFRARGRLSDAQCRRLQNVIRDRLHEDLSLNDLAAVAKLSPRHFSTLFREAFGVSPHQYVLLNRLSEGARLLASEGQDIVDVALRLGFSSQSHFASAFRRTFGVTPRQYAAEKRKSFASL
jgi:AraC-like DNA-binding protein